MKKAFLLVLIFSVVLGMIFWRYSDNFLKKEDPKDTLVSLTYWGLAEDESKFRPVIAAYQQSHPNVKINFTRQSLLNYRTRLQTQLQAGQGPDIFRIHSSWVPMFAGDLSSAPDSVMSAKEFNQTFYPIAKEALVLSNKVYGLPFETDGLAMYINTDILQAVGAGVPGSWQELIDVARRVTVKNSSGQIQTAGVALGTTNNVDFWSEIIGTLFMQQPEGNLAAPGNRDGTEVLQFYTSFVTDPKNKTWDVTLPSSSQMFSEGRLAFYFGPSAMAGTFQAGNPNLRFKVAAVPQLPGKKAAFGGFWFEAVSSRSTHQKEAWEFLKHLSSNQVLPVLALGTPYSRQDLAGLQVSDPILGAFVSQAPYHKGWFLNSNTQDAGINEEIIKLYAQAVNDVLQGKDSSSALGSIQPGIQQALDKYRAAR